jgi:predicted anti-sigma-YlaC factor YlaD
MNCQYVQNKLSEYQDEVLSREEQRSVSEHLKVCPICLKKYEELESAWAFLENDKEIKPNAAFISNFWNKVAEKRPWYESLWEFLRTAGTVRIAVPVLAGLLIAALAIKTIYTQSLLAGTIKEEEIAMLASLDTSDELEMLQMMEMLQDWEIIEQMEIES